MSKKKVEAQEVEVAFEISGDYVAFHEISARVLYDFTNDELVDGDSKEEVMELLEEGHDRDYLDCKRKKALKVGGRYYIKF